MQPFLIMVSIFSSLLLLGCAPVFTSETQISKINNYWVLDGVPYFLPKSKIHIDITWSKDENNWIVSVKPVIQPDDKSPRFILRTDSSALYDDDITIAVDPNGLLQTVNISTTDKTVSSIAGLAAVAGNAFTFGVGLAPAGLKEGKKRIKKEGKEAPPLPSSFHGDFDPDEINPIIPKLQPPAIDVSAVFTLKFTSLGTTPTQRTDISTDAYPLRGLVEASSEKNISIHGIVLRTPVPYKIDITVNNTVTQSAVLMLPDVNQNYVLPINRRCLVQDKTNITLKDGMIQSIQQVRPSMVAGVVGIPKTILEALAPIPLQIRQSQTSNLQAIDSSLKLKSDIKKSQEQ